MPAACTRRERQILLDDAEVSGILAGSRNEVRRPLKDAPVPQPSGRWSFIVSSTDRLERGMFSYGVLNPDGKTYTERGRETREEYSCPFGRVGDTLWAAEAWRYADWTEDGQPWIAYRAAPALLRRDPRNDSEWAAWGDRLVSIWESLSALDNYRIDNRAGDRRWRASVVMPRWASRLELEITGVRIEPSGAGWDWVVDVRRLANAIA